MEKPVRGDIVVVDFPFSNLSGAKRRPALVVADAGGEDLILCQITGKLPSDQYAVHISHKQAADCGLHEESYVRPNKLFTAHTELVIYTAGRLNVQVVTRVLDTIARIIRS